MMHTITRSVASRNHHVDILPNAMAALWSRTSMFKEFWDVVQAVGTWPGAAITRDRNGVCLTLNGVKLGHLDWAGRLVLPFAAQTRDELVPGKAADREPGQSVIGRSIFNIRTGADVNVALALLRFAYLIADAKQDACASVAAPELFTQS
jgi:hypothetical protein